MSRPKYWNDISNPEDLAIEIYPGANNEFDLYEDDGYTSEYKDGAYSVTKMCWEWDKKRFVINKADGDDKVIVKKRNIKLSFNNITEAEKITVTEDGREINYSSEYTGNKLVIEVTGVSGQLVVQLEGNIDITENERRNEAAELLTRMQYDNEEKCSLYWLVTQSDSVSDILSRMDNITNDKNVYKAIKEIFVADL